MSQGSGNTSKQTEDSNQEKLATWFTTGLKAGGISVGGLGAFWLLFVNSDIPKAIASMGIGGVVSYGGALISPVHQGNKRRFRKVGETIDEAIDSGIERVTESVIQAAKGTENKYLLCQACDCQRLKTEGKVNYEGIFTPLIKDVFIPLEVSRNIQPVGYCVHEEQFSDELLTDPHNQGIWRFLKKAKDEPNFRSLAILAWGGYGKTTLLKHIAFTYGTHSEKRFDVVHRIPVLLVLRKYRDLIADNPNISLPELIATHHVPNLPGIKNLEIEPDWFKQKLDAGDVVVMLDGLDEVKPDQRNDVSDWINCQMKAYEQSIFIITSRPKAFRGQDPAHQLEMSTVLWVQKFNQPQREAFVRKWYDCQLRLENADSFTPDIEQESQVESESLLAQIEARQELKDLAQNPLLLNMIVTFHRRYPGATLPSRRVDLYEAICKLRLKDQPAARQLETLLINCNAQNILQKLALSMVRDEKERVEYSLAKQQITEILNSAGESVTAAQFLAEVVEISELLIQQEDEVEFAHKSFKDYLASLEIAVQKQEAILYQHFDESDENWRDVILLYAGHTNPAKLLKEMLKQDKADFADRCLQSTTKRVEESLQSEVTEFKTVKASIAAAKYQKLDQALKTGQWKEADNETYRLMIEAVDKEVGQFFTSGDELLNFPCDILLAIDELWVKHSEGKFGFSVQKDIYQKCGGKLDGLYNSKAYRAYYDSVGWESPKFSKEAPKGHLPLLVIMWRGASAARRVRFSSLASRLAKCNL